LFAQGACIVAAAAAADAADDDNDDDDDHDDRDEVYNDYHHDDTYGVLECKVEIIILIPLQEMWPSSGAEAEVVKRLHPHFNMTLF
jgi:hypothetical protein